MSGDRLLRAREVADLLGLSPATVLDWFESGRLPGFKLSSRAVRFRESEVLAWLEERRVTRCDSRKVSLATGRQEV
ncbi:MAG TPA: helix-turn-helix domain-containing protein [Gaiellaceae bacterium]